MCASGPKPQREDFGGKTKSTNPVDHKDKNR